MNEGMLYRGLTVLKTHKCSGLGLARKVTKIIIAEGNMAKEISHIKDQSNFLCVSLSLDSKYTLKVGVITFFWHHKFR